jgi:hypothetical protein
MKIMFPESKTLTCCCKEKDPEPFQAKLERLLNVDQEISIQALKELGWIHFPLVLGDTMLSKAWFDRDYDWAGPPLARSDRWQDPEGI